MAKVKTTKIGGGADYAKVADRLKLFWEENPNGKVETERENLADGKIRFIARIWRDNNVVLDLAKSGASMEVIKLTASATASADFVKKGDKENEKLETVAVGRALATLGYLASGEVASKEEMEQFEEYKQLQKEQSITEAIDLLNTATNMDELKAKWPEVGKQGGMVWNEPRVIAAKDELKKKFSEKQAEVVQKNDNTDAIKAINDCKDNMQLTKVWLAINSESRKAEEVKAAYEAKKEELKK